MWPMQMQILAGKGNAPRVIETRYCMSGLDEESTQWRSILRSFPGVSS